MVTLDGGLFDPDPKLCVDRAQVELVAEAESRHAPQDVPRHSSVLSHERVANQLVIAGLGVDVDAHGDLVVLVDHLHQPRLDDAVQQFLVVLVVGHDDSLKVEDGAPEGVEWMKPKPQRIHHHFLEKFIRTGTAERR